MDNVNIICGDALTELRRIPDETFNCCVTSPPYFALRDYGIDGQIGLESSPDEYVGKLVEVFREVKRVLRSDGTLWLNLGDSYAGSGKGAWSKKDGQKEVYVPDPDSPQTKLPKTYDGIKAKDMIGIPWIVAFALRADGWYLRQDIIWQKPNPMPESVSDRCTKSHEYIFMLSKSPKYYYDGEAISEPATASTMKRIEQDVDSQIGSERVPGKTNGNMKAKAPRYGGKKYTEGDPENFYRTKSGNAYDWRPRRNKRDVWTIATEPHREAHFAMFPKELARNCILAGCPRGGRVLDCFCGGGTTGVVSVNEGRGFTGIELNPKYVDISWTRICNETEFLQEKMV